MGKKLSVFGNSRKAEKFRGPECLNCGTPLELTDKFCPYCSQMNTSKQLSLKDFFGEFIGSILTYDSRFRYTIKDLLFKPGTITRNYVQGKRLKYANPFRFFLSVSIIYFILQSLITTFAPNASPFVNNTGNSGNASNIPALDSLAFEDVIITNNGKTDTIKFGGANIMINNDTLVKAPKKDAEEEYKHITEEELDTINWVNRVIKRFTFYRKFYKKTEIKDPVRALDSLKHNNTTMNRWLYGKNDSVDRVRDNPFGFFNYMMSKVPFFLFFFTPFFAFFFWLIYSKKKYTYMEHMILIFHIFTFIFLGMLLCLIPDMLIGDDILAGILFIFIGPFYFYKALRNFYKQNRIVTILKFFILNIFFWVSSSIGALIFFAITAAAY